MAEPSYMTHRGNAERLVRKFGGGFRHVAGTDRDIVWNGTIWRPDLTGQVMRWATQSARQMFAEAAELEDRVQRKELIDWAHKSESYPNLKATVELARTERGIAVLPEQLDADPYLAGAPNGTIDLRSMNLLDPDPKHYITKQVAAPFDPDAEAPLWDAFLSRIMAQNDELINYLQCLAGLWLTADISVQELPIFWGAGANGKSVFLDTIAHVFGDYAGTAPENLLTDNGRNEHPTIYADLQGKRIIMGSETETGARLRVSFIKRSTGDAKIKARKMRENYSEWTRSHKTVLSTNAKPVITDTTHAIWRRVKLVPFTVTIPQEEQDRDLTQKLKAEASGILAWACRGCIDFLANGLRTPRAVEAASEIYRAESDPLADFLAERTVRGGHCRVSRAHVHESYLSWCAQNGDRHPMERNALYEHLRRVSGVSDDQWREAGSPVRGFVGIGLTHVYSAGAA